MMDTSRASRTLGNPSLRKVAIGAFGMMLSLLAGWVAVSQGGAEMPGPASALQGRADDRGSIGFEDILSAISGSSGRIGKHPAVPQTKDLVSPNPVTGAASQRDGVLTRGRVTTQKRDLVAPPREKAVKTAQRPEPFDPGRLEMKLQTVQQQSAGGPPTAAAGEQTNSIGMKLIRINAGSFVMGSSSEDTRVIQSEWSVDASLLRPEQPAHAVRITEPFLMGKYGVTVGQFRTFVQETGYRTVAEKQGWGWVYDDGEQHWVKKQRASWRNPGYDVWDDHPVTLVCHQDADAFCAWLSKRENRQYRLPTEAQWEYAARGGKNGTRFPWGDDYPDGKKLNMADRRSHVPWADRTMDDAHERAAPVGTYQPNGFWLYDMVGNMWALCADFYDGAAYEADKAGVTTDPSGPKSGAKRSVRGGNWAFGPGIARIAFRFGIEPDLCVDLAGFRVVASLPEAGQKQQVAGDNPFSKEGLTATLDRIKNLAAQGRRLEAAHEVAKLPATGSGAQGSAAVPRPFVPEVLDAVSDVARDKTLPSFTNSLGMKMVRIPAGSFIMGSSEADIGWAIGTLAQGQPLALENEYPCHKVRITKPFCIGATAVTVGQFRRFVEETAHVTDAEADNGGQVFDEKEGRFEQKAGTSWKNPGWTISDEQPVAMVSYDDARAFVEWLAAKEKLPYKLPTEAQWEYACRGGIPAAQFPWGDQLPDGRRANYADQSTGFEWRDRTADDGYKHVAPVGIYEPNGYGLYDMAGNVLEWVRDCYGEDYYRHAPEADPQGPGHGENRVMKGGDWGTGAVSLRCAFRGWAAPDLANNTFGFRVCIEPDPEPRAFSFSEDFLTRKWVPAPDHQAIAQAVAKEKERAEKARRREAVRTAPKEPPVTYELVKGVLVLEFTPKSDARKAGMQKGDVIVEYNGKRELDGPLFLALTADTKRTRDRPLIVFVRDGYEHSVRTNPGFLGITITDTTVRGPFKKPDSGKEREPVEVQPKRSRHLDWT